MNKRFIPLLFSLLAVATLLVALSVFVLPGKAATAQAKTSDLVYRGHTAAVIKARWSPDGNQIASASLDGTVKVWNAQSGKTLFTHKPASGGAYTVAWSHNGKYIAVGTFQVMGAGIVEIVDVKTHKTVLTYRGHKMTVTGVDWSHDDKLIASSSDDATVQIWNSKTGKLQKTYHGHPVEVNALAWSWDDTKIASASFNGDRSTAEVHVWNTKTLQTITIYSGLYGGHTDLVNSVAWTFGDKFVLSASNDKTVRLWESATGKTAGIYKGHTAAVTSASFSYNGTEIVSSSTDKTVILFDTKTTDTIYVYKGHSKEVYDASGSPKRNVFASASEDNTVRVWLGM